MPSVEKNEKQGHYMERCVPMVLKELGGNNSKNRPHAIAKCLGMFKEKFKESKSSCLAKCSKCGTLANLAIQPEICMGAVRCKKCGNPVTQATLLQQNSRGQEIDENSQEFKDALANFNFEDCPECLEQERQINHKLGIFSLDIPNNNF
jgi:hypothetical protein